MSRKHQCPNQYTGEGANGGCFFEIREGATPGMANLYVGWSCVIVHQQQDVPVTWLSELIAIATAHAGGIGGFLAVQRYGGGDDSASSYALMCDPAAMAKESVA